MSLLVADDVHLQFRGRALFEGATLAVERRDRLGIIGANGTGKSTFLKIMVGVMTPDSGRITRARGLRVGYLPQELPEGTDELLIDSVLAMAPRKKDVEARLAEVEAELHQTTDADQQVALAETLADLHAELGDLERLYGRHRAESILAGLRFKQSELAQPLSAFSGGWRMRAALAGLLFMGPDVLMLDEPTNHLDLPSVQWLNGFLRDYPHALVLICHDREFLNRHVTRVASLEVEGLRTYKGNYDQYLVTRELEIELLENRAKRQEQRTKELEAFVERFKAKASKARQAQSKAKQIEKLMEDAVEVPRVRRAVSLVFPPSARSGEVAVETRGITHAYGPKRVLANVSVAARRGDRVAIVGLNGAGKTTLLRILAGELPASEGEVKLGYNVERSYFAQHHADVLRRESTILEEVWRARPDASQTEARAICGAFLFSGDDVDKEIGVLSGGERARVALARLLAKPGNLLLLDEPTNHLDTESAEKLTVSLEGYDGTLLFVSHNLDFARRLSTKVWDVHDGIVEEYPGSLADYLDRLAGEDAKRAGGETSTAAVPANAAKAPATMTAGGSGGAPVFAVPAGASAKEARMAARQAESERRKIRGAIEKRVAKVEADVASFEAEVARLEGVLADPATHADVAKARELAKAYEDTKKKLEVAMTTWEKESEALAKHDAETQ